MNDFNIIQESGIIQQKQKKKGNNTLFCLACLLDIISRNVRCSEAFDRVLAQRARVGRILQRFCQGLVVAVQVELAKDLKIDKTSCSLVNLEQ